VRRQFRGATYHIHVTNPDGVSKGVKEMRVNGELVDGNKAPIFTSGDHQVDVILG
jgi:cellobiose phosphorylase